LLVGAPSSSMGTRTTVQSHSMLQRLIPQANRSTLTQHLRELERDGIVHREMYREMSPKWNTRSRRWAAAWSRS
jgi:DNA-binding HxlR family transcriptional regulator